MPPFIPGDAVEAASVPRPDMIGPSGPSTPPCPRDPLLLPGTGAAEPAGVVVLTAAEEAVAAPDPPVELAEVSGVNSHTSLTPDMCSLTCSGLRKCSVTLTVSPATHVLYSSSSFCCLDSAASSQLAPLWSLLSTADKRIGKQQGRMNSTTQRVENTNACALYHRCCAKPLLQPPHPPPSPYLRQLSNRVHTPAGWPCASVLPKHTVSL